MAVKMSLAFCALIASALSIIISAKAEEVPGLDVPLQDPAQIVAKALLCFNDKYIYESCDESCRLSASGNLEVAAEETEAFCSGPCLRETHLVLGCLEDILSGFIFYNRATIQDVRDTVHAGCGYGPDRGNFNVLDHIQARENPASPAPALAFELFLTLVLGHALL